MSFSFQDGVESPQKWGHGAEPGAAQSQHCSGLWTRRAAGMSLDRNCCKETPQIAACPGPPRACRSGTAPFHEQLSPRSSYSRSLQMLLEAAYSQLKFISGLCVCLLKAYSPQTCTDNLVLSGNSESPACICGLPDFPDKGSHGGESG